MLDGDDTTQSSDTLQTSKDEIFTKKKKMDKKKKKKRGGSKRKLTPEQALAHKAVSEWVCSDYPLAGPSCSGDFGIGNRREHKERVVFELHAHSKHSDGFLSPSKVVERAHSRGVKVLALTDHDTMSGIPEAVEAAQRFGIKIIPGVEISTVFSPQNRELEEPVHILAYYSSCGPKSYDEVESFLANIREGRVLRAKEMVLKLNKLKIPLKWEHVARIAGQGVAPGRLHVARAMVEAGYVENLKQAFARHLYDGGPAYSTGREPFADKAIQLIRETGGLAVLAHPWSLKDPVAIIRKLKNAGLHGVEVHRSDGKLAAYSDLADAYGLLKLGGSDYHGRGGNSESELGSVNLPVTVLHNFLEVARPIWCETVIEILSNFADEPSNSNLARMTRFGKFRILKENNDVIFGKDVIDHCLSLWLPKDDRHCAEFEAIRLKLSSVRIESGGIHVGT